MFKYAALLGAEASVLHLIGERPLVFWLLFHSLFLCCDFSIFLAFPGHAVLILDFRSITGKSHLCRSILFLLHGQDLTDGGKLEGWLRHVF